MAQSYIPLVEPATAEDLQQISDDLKLGVNSEQMKGYLEWVNNSLKACETMREIEEDAIPVLYPRIPGVKPDKAENPYNAWATKLVLKGEDTGLLAGKKLAVKDNIFIAGTPLANGSKIWDGYTPEFDATVVTRILQAGGTIVGKSTCENQCYSGNSFTSASGPVLNPHDTTRSAGGSSSGSAVLVVAGDVDMALGGDQGGSVRLPSSWSGCVGLKPTFGLVPVTGSLGMEPSFDHIGPMTSNVKDCATLLEVIAGYDEGRDHRQSPGLAVPKYSQMLKGDLSGLKFGYVTEGFKNATPGVKSAIDGVVAKLRSAGATVEDVSIPSHIHGGVLFVALLAAYYESMIRNNGQAPGFLELYNRSAAKHMRARLQTNAHDLMPTVKAISLFGEFVRRKDGNQLIAMAMNQRPTVRKGFDRALNIYDALIMPTIPFVALPLPKFDSSITEFITATLVNTENTGVFNVTGHPALSMPVGCIASPDQSPNAKPLPVGLQITCKHFEEAKLLDIAYGIEKLLAN